MKKRLLTFLGCTLVGFILISATIDLDNLFNYGNQYIPVYITKDNTSSNVITNEIATLGRVLFYDKKLSANNSVSCASCHKQEKGFGDDAIQSIGFNGELTGRHATRLINVRFGDEVKFFWDERAPSLEDQVSMPIQNHVEMGFSGTNGDPDINNLITILTGVEYYQELFTLAFGDDTITKERIQTALAQFVRSIQSFDSKYDMGLAQVKDINKDFPNFSELENIGKKLYMNSVDTDGAGCNTCHRAPEFDIHPSSLNNGIISVLGNNSEIDLNNTRSPTMRDLVNPNGVLNGPLMHDGSINSLLGLINYYDKIPNHPENTNLDNLLKGPGGLPQNLELTESDKDALVAFLKTLTGTNVYINEKWSNPFENDGSILLTGGTLSNNDQEFQNIVSIYPNPTVNYLKLDILYGDYKAVIYNTTGNELLKRNVHGNTTIDLRKFSNGIYFLNLENLETHKILTKKFIKKA